MNERMLERAATRRPQLMQKIEPAAAVLPAARLRTRNADAEHVRRTSHWRGLDVHDAGLYTVDGRKRRFEPRMVLTIEPGLYVHLDDVKTELRGRGVRLEDDVLVREGGADVLTAAVPKEIADIEALRSGRSALT